MVISKITAILFILLASGCTLTPDQYKNIPESPAQSVLTSESANTAKAQAVADASIGVPQVYVDQEFGNSVELVVQSEYFSANGRTCRRYAEFVNGQSVPGLSCKDDAAGWVDIPLSAFIR